MWPPHPGGGASRGGTSRAEVGLVAQATGLGWKITRGWAVGFLPKLEGELWLLHTTCAQWPTLQDAAGLSSCERPRGPQSLKISPVLPFKVALAKPCVSGTQGVAAPRRSVALSSLSDNRAEGQSEATHLPDTLLLAPGPGVQVRAVGLASGPGGTRV